MLFDVEDVTILEACFTLLEKHLKVKLVMEELYDITWDHGDFKEQYTFTGHDVIVAYIHHMKENPAKIAAHFKR